MTGQLVIEAPGYRKYPVQILPINVDQSISYITNHIVSSTVSDKEPTVCSYMPDRWRKVEVSALSVAWQRQASAQRCASENKNPTTFGWSCHTLLTGKKD
ncbi:hypothetical protein ONS95_008723 [Cadophora gregata]|uniref:uncharacterized protein n=1 Tax=Cadophora gregata TaxID=51156 RepID=UPI0026DC9BF1|nr:uncharacterized protein ONS95_008723 [Cadophora gregata]KAK0123714.1 hypothetical protein ONS95_008723 [Cadophora gregata]